MMTVLMCLGLFMGCFGTVKAEIASESLYVKKVENLPEDFIFGMDISSVLSEEASGVKYYDFDGKETDLFRLLADNGINTIRVRIWNNP
jgi:arabinogalactan endo-1,4-beta-galactosidase